jgi:hypothetical protein
MGIRCNESTQRLMRVAMLRIRIIHPLIWQDKHYATWQQMKQQFDNDNSNNVILSIVLAASPTVRSPAATLFQGG